MMPHYMPLKLFVLLSHVIIVLSSFFCVCCLSVVFSSCHHRYPGTSYVRYPPVHHQQTGWWYEVLVFLYIRCKNRKYGAEQVSGVNITNNQSPSVRLSRMVKNTTLLVEATQNNLRSPNVTRKITHCKNYPDQAEGFITTHTTHHPPTTHTTDSRHQQAAIIIQTGSGHTYCNPINCILKSTDHVCASQPQPNASIVSRWCQ